MKTVGTGTDTPRQTVRPQGAQESGVGVERRGGLRVRGPGAVDVRPSGTEVTGPEPRISEPLLLRSRVRRGPERRRTCPFSTPLRVPEWTLVDVRKGWD